MFIPASYLQGIDNDEHVLPEIIRKTTDAALICARDSSSGNTQGCHSGVPYDIHPSMILDTFSPEDPRRTIKGIVSKEKMEGSGF